MLANRPEAQSRPVRGGPRIVALAGIARGQPLLMRILAATGATIEEAVDVPAILTRLSEGPEPDLIVLGWDLAKMEGTEMLRRVRESGGDPPLFLPVPVLPVPGKANVEAEGGPPTPDEMGAETAFHLPPGIEKKPVVVLHLDSCRASWNGRRVDLSLTEFRVVSRLAASPGVDFSHREIYDIMRGEGIVSGRGDNGYRSNVRAAIKRIRRKFVLVDPDFIAIRSYHGFGYRWDESAAVQISAKEDATTVLATGE